MRILAGEMKGRAIIRPKTAAVRPMGDKVRAALFDIVGPLDGASVLDAYSGSGAVGFEALSRGAASVCAVEQSAAVARTIAASAAQLQLADRHRLVVGSVESWLGRSTERFRLIVADPPYAELDEAIIARLLEHLADAGVLALAHSSRIAPPELKSEGPIKTRIFGDSALSFYQQ